MVKASRESTDGHMAVVEMLAPPGFGSPLHVHRREDEWFYVIEGALTVWVDGEASEVPAGSFAYGPRDLPHTFLVSSRLPLGSFSAPSRPGSRTSSGSSASPPKRSRSHRRAWNSPLLSV
jgi:mannose-6-phosphate isomerase-like protein (cupin superfamily)